MKRLFHFLAAVAVVFGLTAFISTAIAAHIYTNNEVFFIVVDWDDNGNVIELNDPAPADAGTFAECESRAVLFEDYVLRQPDRNYVAVCAFLDGWTLDDMIALVISDFNEYFQPLGESI